MDQQIPHYFVLHKFLEEKAFKTMLFLNPNSTIPFT